MNVNTKFAGIALVTALALSGCSAQDGPYGGHSAKWYYNHVSAGQAEYKWCGNQPKDVRHSASCQNAVKAIWDQ
jgi:uncharacterized protein YceK